MLAHPGDRPGSCLKQGLGASGLWIGTTLGCRGASSGRQPRYYASFAPGRARSSPCEHSQQLLAVLLATPACKITDETQTNSDYHVRRAWPWRRRRPWPFGARGPNFLFSQVNLIRGRPSLLELFSKPGFERLETAGSSAGSPRYRSSAHLTFVRLLWRMMARPMSMARCIDRPIKPILAKHKSAKAGAENLRTRALRVLVHAETFTPHWRRFAQLTTGQLSSTTTLPHPA